MITRLPRVWFFTDPQRTPDPAAIASRLPRGAGVVFRHFGAADRLETARTLARIARRRGLVLLIGADPALAQRVRADGVHLPERDACNAAQLKCAQPLWIVTAAAHSPAALDAASAADAAVLSPIFPSRSPSAGVPLGLGRATRMMRAATVPVIGLGGVTRARAGALIRRGFAGAAGIEMFVSADA